MDEWTNKQLVEQSQSGDQAAYALLVKRHSRALFLACLGKLGNVHDAEDVTQETLIRGYTQITTLRDPDKFIQWLLRIGRNVVQKSCVSACCETNISHNGSSAALPLISQTIVWDISGKPSPDSPNSIERSCNYTILTVTRQRSWPPTSRSAIKGHGLACFVHGKSWRISSQSVEVCYDAFLLAVSNLDIRRPQCRPEPGATSNTKGPSCLLPDLREAPSAVVQGA